MSERNLWFASVEEPSVPSKTTNSFAWLYTNICALSAGASVKVRVVPLAVQLVVPSFAVSVKGLLSTVTCIVSVVEVRFDKVKAVVVPSPTNLSVVTCSSCIENGSSETVVADSRMTASSVKVESSNVPDSKPNPPPTIVTKPVAAFTFVSAVCAVKVTVSPTS